MIGVHMGETAENVARRFDVSRVAQDAYALESQQRAQSDLARAAFRDEIIPVIDAAGIARSMDQAPRPRTTMASLSRLAPAFVENGTVTAGRPG